MEIIKIDLDWLKVRAEEEMEVIKAQKGKVDNGFPKIEAVELAGEALGRIKMINEIIKNRIG